jgi:hypothetical protein
MSISTNLRFHLQGIDDLDEVWTKLEVVFGKHNEIQMHQLENQLISLNLMISFELNIIYLGSKQLDVYLQSKK